MSDVRELLPLYALGALDGADAEAVERAVEADPALARELDRCFELVPPLSPSPAVKARLMAMVGGGRFDAFTDRLAALFDVSLERVRELLGMCERPASWIPAAPGIRLIHFAGGPAAAHADCGFVHIDPHSTFPWHAHKGEETIIILLGSMRDHEGTTYAAGDRVTRPIGSEHALTTGDEPVLYAARAINGIDIKPR